MFMVRVVCGGLLCALVAFSGCEQPSAAPAAAEQPAKRRSFGRANARPTTEPVTCEDCQRIALAIHGCIEDENIAAADLLIDWDSILTKAARGQEIPPESRPELIRVFTGDNGFFGSFEPEIAAGGAFELLHMHFEGAGAAGLWYRFTHASGALTYFDLKLGRGADGKVLVRDIFVAAFGDTISNTFNPVIAHALYDPRRLHDGLRERYDHYFAGVEQIGPMRQRMKAQDFAGALAIYERFPEQLKSHKRMITLRLECALSLGQAEQLAAVEFAEARNHPAGSLDLSMLQVYLKLGKFDAANACIDRLNRMIGGDPELSNERIMNLLAAGRTAEARSDSDLAVWLSPYSGTNLLTALTIAKRQRDFARMANLLSAFEASGVELPDFDGMPFYEEFVKSSEYASWLAERQAAQSEAAAAENVPPAEVATEYSAWPRVQ